MDNPPVYRLPEMLGMANAGTGTRRAIGSARIERGRPDQLMSTSEQKPEQQWAIVEVFGHNRYAGTVSEHQIGGCSFVRVDIPEMNGEPAFSKLFGNAAIYSITPVSEQIARLVAREFQSRPLTVYIRELEEDVRRRRLGSGEED